MVANLAEAKNHPVDKDVFLKLDASIRSSKRELEDASAEVAREKKAARLAGVNPLAYSMMEKIRKLDADERPIVVRALVQFCEWVDMPIGTQTSLIDAPKMPKPKPLSGRATAVSAAPAAATQRASEAGLIAGREGDDADTNPYPSGSPESAAWAKSHLLGLGERATAARMHGEPADAVTDKGRRTRKHADHSRLVLSGSTTH